MKYHKYPEELKEEAYSRALHNHLYGMFLAASNIEKRIKELKDSIDEVLIWLEKE